ncbi:MAG: M56 family metallopeptidase [Gemmatimonadales bacterium]
MSALSLQLMSIRSGALTPVFGLLIDTALKGSVLIAAAAIVAYLLRDRSAAARHAAWSAAVIGHLALPVLTLLMPQWRLPVLPAPPWLDTPAVTTPALNAVSNPPAASPASTPTVDAVTSSTGAAAPTSRPGSPSPAISTPAQSGLRANWPLISTLGLLWILGTTLVLLRLAIGTWRVGRLAKLGDRVDDGEWLSLTQRLANRLGITRPLILLRGDRLAVPVTWGIVYPAVLLPPDSHEWPEARRRFVLVHEMAHVKRFDALTQLLAQVAVAVLWFDPLIWLAAHGMRVEREHACDDYVLRDGTVPSLYAGELLEMVQSIGSPRHESAAPAFAALAMARRSEFEGRMLAILDPRQNRHTLGRSSAVITSVALALLVIPLAALRPFHNGTAAGPLTKAVAPNAGAVKKSSASERLISDTACDSARRAPGSSASTHIHVGDDDAGSRTIEYMATSGGRCAQAAVIGDATFANDRLLSLSTGAYATFREVTSDADRAVHIAPRDNGTMEVSAKLNGAPVAYDDAMRAWLARIVPEVLREAAVDAPQRVARDMAQGGVSLVLAHIGRIMSPSSKRAHYAALLDGIPLTESEYAQVSRHVTRTLADSPSDLSAVLTRLAASPAKGVKSLGAAVAKLGAAQEAMGVALGRALGKSSTSSDSTHTLTQYAVTDDPDMILLALRGAKDISSSTDKRTLLQTIAAGALRRRSAALRSAFFDVTATMDSDTDLRAVLNAALPYAHSDQAIAFAVFNEVKGHMSSDTDKRAVLTAAVEQKLLSTPQLREAFMAAAKSISSSTDYTAVMRAAFSK